MELDLVVTEGLGDSSFLLTWGDEAVAIDPQRDAWRLTQAAERRRARVRTVLETHVHNDYVSGATELRSATGARIAAPARGGYAFAHTALEDGAEVNVGDGTLVAMATPGHTPEHVAYVLRDPDGEPVALFSGGSLMVGGAGRTDLLSRDRTDELTRLQFRSLRRIAALPDHVQVLPTHGSGSFCSAGPAGRDRTSTIAHERATNPALDASDEDAFVRRQLGGLDAFPAYYAHMAAINRTGPEVRGAVPMPPAQSPDEVASLVEGGARVVDAREGTAFANAHLPRTLSVPLEPSFAAYVGWLLPFGVPIVLVVDDDAALVEAATQLWRIGWEPVGHLAGGVAAWSSSGRPTRSYAIVELDGLLDELAHGSAGSILDVRQRSEWDRGHLEESRHVFVGDLAGRLDDLPTGERQTVVCASGYRSSMAASLLDAAGVPVRLVPRSGVPRALRVLAPAS